jgi:tyrosine-protein phosphatase YwqE
MASWISKWLRRRRPETAGAAPDFSAEPLGLGKHLHMDVHCHLLPGVDDGVNSIEEALEMIERLRRLGYRGSVLTSHIYAELYPNSRATLVPAYEKLQAAVLARWPDYQLQLAAEYYVDMHFEACIASGDLLWFPGMNERGEAVKCVLFEFGFHEAPPQAKEVVFQLQMDGYQPVLAHVERYPYWHQDFSLMEDLHDRGVWLTLNAASLAGAYGPETYDAARQVLERGWCRFLCSDAHGLRHIEALEAVDRSPMVQDWVNGEAAALQRGLLQAGD